MEESISNEESANTTSHSNETEQLQQHQQDPQQQQDSRQQQDPQQLQDPPQQQEHQQEQHDQEHHQQQQQQQQQQPDQEQQQQQPQTHPQQQGNILEAIKDFDSSIPDAVVHHFLNVAGMQTNDQRIIRLIAIAAQKFIHDIVSDSLQHCKLRGSQNKKAKEKKYTLSIDDLTSALAEYGIEIKRQPYFN